MALIDKIQTDLVAAMKSGDRLKLDTLRSVKTALDRYRVDKRKPADEKAEQDILGTLVKQRQEASDAFTKGGRTESADKELAEKAILESYMSPLASPVEIATAIEVAISNLANPNPGLVMKQTQTLLAGKRVDNKALMTAIRERLA